MSTNNNSKFNNDEEQARYDYQVMLVDETRTKADKTNNEQEKWEIWCDMIRTFRAKYSPDIKINDE
jgi:hypothetical protein